MSVSDSNESKTSAEGGQPAAAAPQESEPESTATPERAEEQPQAAKATKAAKAADEPKAAKAAKAAEEPKAAKEPKEPKERPSSKERAASRKSVVDKVRTNIAQVVWLIAVVCALFLAIGALLIALGANRDNSLVKFVLDTASAVDLTVFSRVKGVFHFDGSNAATKNALANWGLGAVAYLVVGRIVERIIRP